ncbi:MAG: pilus assembly protein [Deltaproteobacteria bacterium]|nr:pilus assembly protein [Deltaproteobacteria bacterium]
MKTRKRVRDEKGVAAVEFALVLPILLILLFGIVEFSLLLYDKAMITNAAREGARVGIVYDVIDPDGIPDNGDENYHPPDSVIQAAITQYLQDFLIDFDPANPMPPPLITRHDEGDFSIVKAYGSEDSGDSLRVEIQYQYDFLVLPRFISGIAGGNIKAVTVMRLE